MAIIASASVYIDIAFIPIYAILLAFLGLNLFNHRRNGFATFGFAVAFAISRLVGNVLLVIANYYKGSTSTIQNLYIAGIIVQSIGFAFLINSALALLSGVVGKEEKNKNKKGGLLTGPQKLAHLLAMIATILVIVGMTSIDFTPETLSGQQSIDLGTGAKAGNAIFIAIVILLGATIFYFLLLSGKHLDSSQKLTLRCLLFNILPMMIRSAWLCYRAFGSKNYFVVNVWAQLALQYIPELIVVVVYTVLGFLLTYKFKPSEPKFELEQREFLGSAPAYSSTSHESEQERYLEKA